MKKVKKVLRVGINLVAIYLIIRFLGYLLIDEPMWKSPYDEVLVKKRNSTTLDMEKGDLESLLYAVGEYAEKWTGKQELLEIWFYSENNTFFSTCRLYYGAGRIDEYWGRCIVTCVYNKEKGYWEITEARKEYRGEKYSVSKTEDIIESYNNALEFILENYSLRQAGIDLHLRGQRGYITMEFINENKKIRDEFNLEDKGNKITQVASYENDKQVNLMREFLKNTLVLP